MFTAVFDKKTYNVSIDCNFILLIDIKYSNGELFRDHMWVSESKRFKSLNLTKGDVISFTGKVTDYLSSDLKPKLRVKHIRNIKKVG